MGKNLPANVGHMGSTLVWEDSTRHEATKPVCQLRSQRSESCEPQPRSHLSGPREPWPWSHHSGPREPWPWSQRSGPREPRPRSLSVAATEALCLEPVLCSKRSRHSEKPALQWRGTPTHRNWGKPVQQQRPSRHLKKWIKWIANKDLLCSTGNSAQCYVAAWMGDESRREGIPVYLWLNLSAVHLKLSQCC